MRSEREIKAACEDLERVIRECCRLPTTVATMAALQWVLGMDTPAARSCDLAIEGTKTIYAAKAAKHN